MPSPEYQKYRKFLELSAFPEAADLAEKQYLKDNKKNPFWLTRQAAALSRAGRYDASLAVARRALELKPSDAYALLAVAEALIGLKQFKKARPFYEEISDHPKLAPFARRGILASLAPGKNWLRMLQLLAAWNLPELYDLPWRVQALIGENRIDEAFDACRRWLTLKPDHPGALWALTDLEIRRDGMEAVLKRMGKMAKIASRPPIYKQIYASLCRKTGKPEVALQQYDKLSGIGTSHEIQRQQAFTLAKSGKEADALPLIEELLKLDPGDIYLNSAYAGACGRIQSLDRAITFYEKLLELHPLEKTIYGRIKAIRKKTG
ncbi:MAG: tetratricopeptide repeat protein [Deltaproteobacteria bacterium]|nr:tetratricopeptide repeat protein [Deltaproteobacteria bacterium]